LGALGAVWLVLTVRLPVVPSLLAPWAVHLALFAGFVVLVAALARHAEWRYVPLVRAIATVGMLFTLYSTLAHVAFVAIPWRGDAWLSRADTLLFFGTNPALWAERHLGGMLEFYSFIYAFFIPYLYMSIALGLVGRPAAEREEFITGFALTYAVSFLGYLFVPARGPIVQDSAHFTSALDGGFFHRTIVASIDAMGGPHGAFPSLHVGAASFACLFDLRHDSLRGFVYLPVVVLIGVSTVFVRYHYIVDLVAGLAIGVAAVLVAPRLVSANAANSRSRP
jgi:membrane-associated phospholipid phosphatase